jgi:hypothetical protein
LMNLLDYLLAIRRWHIYCLQRPDFFLQQRLCICIHSVTFILERETTNVERGKFHVFCKDNSFSFG